MTRSGEPQGEVEWTLAGEHNVENALAAVSAAAHVGVEVPAACAALGRFRGVKRRLEQYASVNGVTLYDDFAHHPTAIRATLNALRRRVGQQRLVAVLEPRSNTMRLGVHRDTLADSLTTADEVYLFQPPNLDWDLGAATKSLGAHCRIFTDTTALIEAVAAASHAGDHLVIMSNGGFEGLHGRLVEHLQQG